MLLSRGAWNRLRLARGLHPAAAPARYVEPEVLTPEGAKLRRLFWCPGVGALRVLENADLFDSLFPGYEAARGDAGLWRRYFTELFDQTVYSAALMKESTARSLRISASSLGSMDLFRKYGADVLVFGISDSFIPVSAGLLRDGLNETGVPALRDLKILQCARGHLTPPAVSWYAQGLNGRGKKVPLAMWGFSLVYAHRQPLEDMSRREVRTLYKSWRAENNIERFDRRFPHPSWDMLLGAKRPTDDLPVPGGLLIPDAAAADPRALDAFLDKADASVYSIGHDRNDCDMSQLSRETDAALTDLLQIADKVLIYIPPSSPLDRRGAPSCILPNLTAMLESKAGPRVSVETGDWTAYGLNNGDYLYATPQKGVWTIDPLHANDAGSRKISRVLARRAAAVLTDSSSRRP
jgi:hypothetical protein